MSRFSGKNSTKDLESLDGDHPVALLLGSLFPSVVPMNSAKREELKEKILALHERLYLGDQKEPVGVADGSYSPDAKNRNSWRLAFMGACAAFLILTLVFYAVLFMIPGKKQRRFRYFAFAGVQLGIVEMKCGEGSWERVRAGEMVYPGARLRSGKGSFATMIFPDGSALRLAENSRACIESIEFGRAAVRHLAGTTYHRTQKGSSYVVRSGDIRAWGDDSAFNVGNSAGKNLEILSVRNVVNVEVGSHPPIPVNEGEVMVVSVAGARKAEKVAVSKERLEDRRLVASVKMDVEEGYSSGIYEKLDVPLVEVSGEEKEESTASQVSLRAELKGNSTPDGNIFEWVVSGSGEYDSVALLRAEGRDPEFPEDEIARFSDISITSARDNNVEAELSYQYRVVALREEEVVSASNTVVVRVPAKSTALPVAQISLVVLPSKSGVLLEWSLVGVKNFEGYVIERTVLKAPKGSRAKAGESAVFTVESSDILDSYDDAGVEVGCEYSYRVGLLVDGSVVLYSDSRKVFFSGK